LLLDILVDKLRLRLGLVLIPNDSLRDSWLKILVLSIEENLRIALVILNSLVNNFSVLSLIRSVSLGLILYIAWIVLVITIVLLRNISFLNSKEIDRSLISLFSDHDLLFMLSLSIIRLIVPLNIYSLLRNVILSRLTILIDKSLDIPSQLFVNAVFPHSLNQLLFLSMIKLSIWFVNFSQIWSSKQREHRLAQSKPIVGLILSKRLFSLSFDFLI
jgi:hypothetical protein